MAPTILAGLFVWFAKGKGQNSSGPATKNFASGQRTVSATFKPDFDPRTPHRRGQPRASSAAPAEAAHRAREMRAEMRNDPRSAYNNPQDPAHKQTVHEMNLLYGAERYDDGSPVLLD